MQCLLILKVNIYCLTHAARGPSLDAESDLPKDGPRTVRVKNNSNDRRLIT